MNLAQAILGLYPDLDPTRDFRVQDDGEGPYLAEWNNPNPRPAAAELGEGLLLHAKAAKTEEIATEAVDALAPMFTPGKGRDETALLVAGHVLKLCEALKVPPDPRLREVVATGERALRLKAEVGAAGSVEELEGVTWT